MYTRDMNNIKANVSRKNNAGVWVDNIEEFDTIEDMVTALEDDIVNRRAVLKEFSHTN